MSTLLETTDRLSGAAIVRRIAPTLGITVIPEPFYGRVGQLITPDDRRFFFRGSNVGLNNAGAAKMAQDKAYASYFIAQAGYPIPEGKAFYPMRVCKKIGSPLNEAAAFQYAQELGFPVIVKPNSKSEGLGVQRVDTEADFHQALEMVFVAAKDRVALVQRPVFGEDYRFIVLDNEVIAAYRRHPLSVAGDGQSTILDLMQEKQRLFDVTGRDTRIRFNDPRIAAKLKRAHLDLSTIPTLGQKLTLLDNSNLSTGGEAEDVTDFLNPDYKKIAVELTRLMGLRLCGVDIMTPDPIEQSPSSYTVIEVNAAPGLDYYTEAGDKQLENLERLYRKVLTALL